MTRYEYVGRKEIRKSVEGQASGLLVSNCNDILRWLRETGQPVTSDRKITATFVVDQEGALRLAHRRSEHVACAGGRAVLSAGEMTFSLETSELRISSVTNQSTGYCPPPSSWVHVAAALDRIGIRHPGGFTTEFIFRRCPRCRELGIVKDDWYVCEFCGSELPSAWNVSPVAGESG